MKFTPREDVLEKVVVPAWKGPGADALAKIDAAVKGVVMGQNEFVAKRAWRVLGAMSTYLPSVVVVAAELDLKKLISTFGTLPSGGHAVVADKIHVRLVKVAEYLDLKAVVDIVAFDGELGPHAHFVPEHVVNYLEIRAEQHMHAVAVENGDIPDDHPVFLSNAEINAKADEAKAFAIVKEAYPPSLATMHPPVGGWPTPPSVANIVEEIVKVQPMTAKTGQVFHFHTDFENEPKADKWGSALSKKHVAGAIDKVAQQVMAHLEGEILDATTVAKAKQMVSSYVEQLMPNVELKSITDHADGGKLTFDVEFQLKHAGYLQNVYLDGPPPGWKWNHTPNQKLDSPEDVEAMFEAVCCATEYYVTKVQGVEAKGHEKQISKEVRGLIDVWVKGNLTANVGGVFDTDMLVTAITQKVCGEDKWSNAWKQFIGGMYDKKVTAEVAEGMSMVFKDPGEFPNQIKAEVHITAPKPAENIELHLQIGDEDVYLPTFGEVTEEYADNDDVNVPVPCAPPWPVEATKVPCTDQTGEPIAQPAPGWYVGDDMCWHPPVKEIDCTHIAKQVEVDHDAFKLIAALDHPGAQFEMLKKAAMKEVCEEQAKQLAHDLVVYGQAFADGNGDAIDPASVHKVVPGHKSDMFPAQLGYVYAPYMPVHTTPPLTVKDILKKYGTSDVSVGCQASVGKDGHLIQESPLVASPVLKKIAAYDPKPIDDRADGYNVANFWVNSKTGDVFACVDDTVGHAKWEKVAGLEPAHLEEAGDGKVILVPSQPKKTYSFWSEAHEGDKAELQQNYLNTEIQTCIDPEAEKDLVAAMTEQIKKDIDAQVVQTLLAAAPPPSVQGLALQANQVDKNGVSYSSGAIKSMAEFQDKFIKATMIPPQLLGMVKKT